MPKIKAFFGDWIEVSKEEAIRFARKTFKINSRVGYDWSDFDKHIKGLDYEEVRTTVDPSYEPNTSTTSRGIGGTSISRT